jgi:hypothetical protein
MEDMHKAFRDEKRTGGKISGGCTAQMGEKYEKDVRL